MNYLQDPDGNTIVVPDNVLLYKGIASFRNFSIRGEYSTDFEIPADSQNRAILEFYGTNQKDKVVEKPFALYIDGNKVSDGRVVIRSVSESFDIFFIGGNANWLNLISGTIKDLDLSAYDVPFNVATIISRMSATDGIIFPVMDWAYNFKKLSNSFHVSPITGVSVDSFYDFYPCFHVHTILKKIFTQHGIKVAGNLFDDPVFNSIIITPEEIQSSAYLSQVTSDGTDNMSVNRNASTFQNFGGASYVVVEFDEGSANFDNANDRIVLVSDINDCTVTIELQFTLTNNVGGKIGLFKNGVLLREQTYTYGDTSAKTINASFQTGAAVAGDYFDVQYVRQPSGTADRLRNASATFNFISVISSDNNVYVSNMLPGIDQIEFIKTYASRFNCLLEFQEQTQTLTFTMLDKILKENAQDLTDSLVSYAEIPSSGYASRNYVRTTEAEELVNYKTEDLSYGDSLIESDGDGNQDIFKTWFRPAESFVNQNLDWLLTHVPLVRLEDADEGLPITSVTDASGFSKFNISNLTQAIPSGSVVRIESDLYSGFAVVDVTDTLSITPYYVPFFGTATGKVYKQKIVFLGVGSRELIVTRGIPVNDINTGSVIYGSINVRLISSGVYPINSIAWAFYAKPNIGTNLDRLRVGLNYGPVLNTGNVTFGSVFHKRLRKIVTGKRLPARFVLSQTQYNNLSLSEFVYLRTQDFEGYFLMDDIDAYKNPYTEVEANLIFID